VVDFVRLLKNGGNFTSEIYKTAFFSWQNLFCTVLLLGMASFHLGWWEQDIKATYGRLDKFFSSTKIQIFPAFFQLELLDISENDLGDDGASSINGCLHRLKILVLSNCGLTHLGIEDLDKAANRDQSKVCTVLI